MNQNTNQNLTPDFDQGEVTPPLGTTVVSNTQLGTGNLNQSNDYINIKNFSGNHSQTPNLNINIAENNIQKANQNNGQFEYNAASPQYN